MNLNNDDAGEIEILIDLLEKANYESASRTLKLDYDIIADRLNRLFRVDFGFDATKWRQWWHANKANYLGRKAGYYAKWRAKDNPNMKRE
ncbi:MAG: hypothetical protein ACE5G1_06650 [bacterium]